MAIVHVAMKSSSTAPPSAAHADYISRVGLYTKRDPALMVESGNMPEFAQVDPHAFWVAADIHERANGRTYTELQIALPRELDEAQRETLARDAVKEFLGGRFAYTLAIHNPLAANEGQSETKDKIDQPHFHLMFSERAIDASTRTLSEDKFFKRSGAKKDPAWNDRNKPDEVRTKWCEMMNRAMALHKIEVKVDPRSWEDQGREELAALVEPKTLRGKGPDAVARKKDIAGLRLQRKELSPPDLDMAAKLAKLHQGVREQIAALEERLKQELKEFDQKLAAARKLARAAVKETKVAARIMAEEAKAAARKIAKAAKAAKTVVDQGAGLLRGWLSVPDIVEESKISAKAGWAEERSQLPDEADKPVTQQPLDEAEVRHLLEQESARTRQADLEKITQHIERNAVDLKTGIPRRGEVSDRVAHKDEIQAVNAGLQLAAERREPEPAVLILPAEAEHPRKVEENREIAEVKAELIAEVDELLAEFWARHPEMWGFNRNSGHTSNLKLGELRAKSELTELHKWEPQTAESLFRWDKYNPTRNSLVAAEAHRGQVRESLETEQAQLRDHLKQRGAFTRMSGLMNLDPKLNRMEAQVAKFTAEKAKADQQIRNYLDYYQQKLKPGYEKLVVQSVKENTKSKAHLERSIKEIQRISKIVSERRREERTRQPQQQVQERPNLGR